jgi:hypothetical protein
MDWVVLNGFEYVEIDDVDLKDESKIREKLNL